MPQQLQIALVGLSTLEQLGIADCAAEVEGLNTQVISPEAVDCADNSRFDIYIVGVDAFARCADFFMSRRHRVILVSPTPNHDSVPNTIGRDTCRGQIIEAISRVSCQLRKERPSVSGSLSQREIEVLRLVASGMTNKEMADRLCISANTVITHRKNISSKLGIKSVSGLSLYAMMNGLIAQ